MEYIDRLNPELKLIEEVDTTIVRIADVTHDGLPDSTIIHFTAENILENVKWECTIVSNGNIVFKGGDNRDSYSFFLDSGLDYWNNNYGSSGLEGYLDEKSDWYFNMVPEKIIVKRALGFNNATFKREYGNSIYGLFPKKLKSFGITDDSQINDIIDRSVERLRSGTYLLELPTDHFSGGAFPMIYVPEVQKFMVFYMW